MGISGNGPKWEWVDRPSAATGLDAQCVGLLAHRLGNYSRGGHCSAFGGDKYATATVTAAVATLCGALHCTALTAVWGAKGSIETVSPADRCSDEISVQCRERAMRCSELVRRSAARVARDCQS